MYRKRDVQFEVYDVNLRDAENSALKDISNEMNLNLSLKEMKLIKEYFISYGRNPTDIELQALAQAWSEHCSYKTSKPILSKFIFSLPGKFIARGDAGVVEFDENYAYALRIESHNHPSAIEPYGGAATGIGGIVRDVLAMGSQPIALVDPLFFGTLDYPIKKIEKGIKHPRYLFSGVVAGIRDYGNRIGIPTVAGTVYFDNGYLRNCVVNVGCLGIVKKDKIMKNALGKNDILLLVGGKTGRDGIHGVTFASAVLKESSEMESRGAVQLGDPIMKEPLIHACLEANEKNLINGLKDLGGGGLSCVVLEMAYNSALGAEVNLENVLLKEEGLAPWEIWVSESQERMMLSVSKKNIKEVIKIFDLYDIPATPIGRAIDERKVRVFYGSAKIFELDTDFYINAPPRNYKHIKRKRKEILNKEPEEKDIRKIFLTLLSSPNIASKEFVIRQYDHEVRGNTILKPLQGEIEHQCHGDATVIKPIEDSYRGLAIACSSAPSYAVIDPFKAGMSAFDEIVRNLVSAGARPSAITNCLNFGNPERRKVLYDFYETVRGISSVASYLNIPIPSGNVSFYNESNKIPIPPTAVLFGVGIISDVRNAVSSELKKEGNKIFLIGETKDEMGGSEYYKLFDGKSKIVPSVELEILSKSINGVLKSIENRLVFSAHDISHGGLAIAIAEMCIGSRFGCEIDIGSIPRLSNEKRLFSESNTRWLLEIEENSESKFRKTMDGLPIYELGKVQGEELVIKENGKEVLRIVLKEMRDSWSNTLKSMMG
ncbi:MAG: phosphoribosylformylglycinamidine synthase subunit PurL [Candidatus Thermoplasmatota archaeon]